MPKLLCPCGFVHNLSAIPDDGYVVVRNKDWDVYLDRQREYGDGFHAVEGTTEREASSRALQEIVQLNGLLYECPNCGRLMWHKKRGEDYQVYVRDDNPVWPER